MFYDPSIRPTTPDLSVASPEALIYVLEHRETWPPEFTKWDYHHGTCCGLQIVALMWPSWENLRMGDMADHAGRALGMTLREVSGWGHCAHWDMEGTPVMNMSEVTPGRVAEKIRAIMAARS